MSSRPKPRLRKRPVSFGNPSLGTYHGIVYTVEERVDPPPLVEGALPVEHLVAMVDVPPDQVPEGVLNLARSHRPWIDHVRIVIADPVDTKEVAKEEVPVASFAALPSPTASAAESAASILAAEQVNTMAESDLVGEGLLEQKEDPPQRTYLVLFELCDDKAADQLVQYLHSQPYTCLDETQVCSLYHVVALQGEDGVSLMSPFFAPSTKSTADGRLEILPSPSTESTSEAPSRSNSPAQEVAVRAAPAEDYNCAVCLEHMHLDAHNGERTSILTTVCNHSFHIECLLQWQDSPCPVCRYDHSGLNETLSQCNVCGTTENNFVCLICGVVACGGGAVSRPSVASLGDASPHCQPAQALTTETPSERMSHSHARQHYDQSLHAYALDTESQHVWDFAGQGYVHRLLQNKDDGKLVEIADPLSSSQERSLAPGLSDAQEGEVVHRKLEGFASQYYTLLKSQLEQQRIFYEGRLEEVRRDHARANRPRKSSDLIAALKQERNQLSSRLSRLQSRRSKVRDDVAFLTSMNESLEANKAPLKKQLENEQRERVERSIFIEKRLPQLQEAVTKLMLQLESGTSAKEEEEDDEEEEDERKPAAV